LRGSSYQCGPTDPPPPRISRQFLESAAVVAREAPNAMAYAWTIGSVGAGHLPFAASTKKEIQRNFAAKRLSRGRRSRVGRCERFDPPRAHGEKYSLVPSRPTEA